MEIGEYNLATAAGGGGTSAAAAFPSSNNAPVTALPTGPYLHYTTIPRRLRPLTKVCGTVWKSNDFSVKF